jgi:hypothetical protein
MELASMLEDGGTSLCVGGVSSIGTSMVLKKNTTYLSLTLFVQNLKNLEGGMGIEPWISKCLSYKIVLS